MTNSDANRPCLDQSYIQIAHTIAWRSTCLRRRVGAVLTEQHGRVVSMGYNGAPRGADHCSEHGCIMRDGHCVRAVHAELNALLNLQVRVSSGVLYSTAFPCSHCIGAMIQTNVRKLVFDESYGMPSEMVASITYLLRSGVEVLQWTGRGNEFLRSITGREYVLERAEK